MGNGTKLMKDNNGQVAEISCMRLVNLLLLLLMTKSFLYSIADHLQANGPVVKMKSIVTKIENHVHLSSANDNPCN